MKEFKTRSNRARSLSYRLNIGPLALVSFMVCFQAAHAQDDFQPGYIRTLQLDTIRGLVNYDPTAIRSGKVEFKSPATNDVSIFTPDEVAGFGFDDQDRYFQSFPLPLHSAGEKVFAELLFRGRANLHSFDQTFYLEKDGAREIIEPEKMRESNQGGGRYVYTHKTYIGTLNRYFSDCLPDKLLRGEVAYSEKDLVDIFKKYSQCSNTPFYQYKKSPVREGKIGFHLLAGISKSSIRFEESDLNVFNSDNSFFLGAGITVPMPFLGDNVFVTAEPTYHNNRYEGKREGYSSAGAVQKDYVIKLSVVKVPVGVKINFSKKPFSPYVRAGLSALFTLKGTWAIEETVFDIDEKTASLVYWGSFGLQKKIAGGNALFAELRLEETVDYIGFYGPSGATNIPSSVSSKMLVFGLNF